MMLGFTVMSLALQCVVVVCVHYKNKRRLWYELMGTVTFTKPAFNKFRVLTNAKEEGHELLSPVSEMMMFKGVEVFAECIPVSVLQVYTILSTEERIDAVVVSALLISATFVAEAVTYMSFVKDIAEESRRKGKMFYGFVPLSGGKLVVVKCSMYLLSFCQLMSKSIAIALLVQVGGGKLAFMVLAAETGFYLLFKVIRRDFRYWMPLPWAVSVTISVVQRIVMKIITDYTCMIHARHPYELGGVYWLFNMLYTQASVFVLLGMRSKANLEEAERWVLKGDDVWLIALCLVGLWTLAIFTLLIFSESGFKHTFYQTTTGWQFSKLMFDTGLDEIRMLVFTDHRSYYDWYGEEVKEWLGEVWDSLHNAKPAWFTETVVASVPFEYIPYANVSEWRSGGSGGSGGREEWVEGGGGEESE